MGGGQETPFSVLVFFPRVKDTDRLEKCPAAFTIIISRNHSTMLVIFQLFIDCLSVRSPGGFQTLHCHEEQRLLQQAEAGGVSGSRLTPPHILGPRRPCPPKPRGPRLPRLQLAPPLCLGGHFRLLSGHSGFGFRGRRLRTVNPWAHLRGKEAKQTGRPTRARSILFARLGEGSWGQGIQCDLRANKAS